MLQLFYYHPDHLGTTNALTDANGHMYQFFLNLPFGETMAEQTCISYYQTEFKFNGKELDKETGMYYYGARYYDPSLSIWMSVDPLTEDFPSWTPYHYVHNNPVNMIDPSGMKAEWKPIICDDGQTHYQAEAGDTAQTLVDQYEEVKTIDQAIELIGGYKVVEGQIITGQAVFDMYGSDVLKLDLGSGLDTDQRKIDQFYFAIQHSRSNNGNSAFYSTDYFSNISSEPEEAQRLKGSVTIDGMSYDTALHLPFYQTSGISNNTKIHPAWYQNYPSGSPQSNGSMFGGFDKLFRFQMPFGFYRNGNHTNVGNINIYGKDSEYSKLRNIYKTPAKYNYVRNYEIDKF